MVIRIMPQPAKYFFAGRFNARGDGGGVTFIEVMVIFIMVSTAVVGTTFSLFYGNRMLDTDMHRQQVLRIVQEEVEYWVARMYLSSPGDPSEYELAAKTKYKSVALDTDVPPIVIWLSRDAIVAVPDMNNFSSTGEPATAYWKITIWAEWDEPDGQSFSKNMGTEVSLTTYVGVPYSL